MTHSPCVGWVVVVAVTSSGGEWAGTLVANYLAQGGTVPRVDPGRDDSVVSNSKRFGIGLRAGISCYIWL